MKNISEEGWITQIEKQLKIVGFEYVACKKPHDTFCYLECYTQEGISINRESILSDLENAFNKVHFYSEVKEFFKDKGLHLFTTSLLAKEIVLHFIIIDMLCLLLNKQEAIIKIEKPKITKELDATEIFPTVISTLISEYVLEIDFQFTYSKHNNLVSPMGNYLTTNEEINSWLNSVDHYV